MRNRLGKAIELALHAGESFPFEHEPRLIRSPIRIAQSIAEGLEKIMAFFMESILFTIVVVALTRYSQA